MSNTLSLERLPEDILSLVCQEVYHCFPGAIRSLVLVCRRLHHVAVKFRYRNLSLHLGPVKNPAKPRRWWQRRRSPTSAPKPKHMSKVLDSAASLLEGGSRSYRLQHIETLTIVGDGWPSVNIEGRDIGWEQTLLQERMALICRVIASIAHLKCLRYELEWVPPAQLIDVLVKHHPSARLELLRWYPQRHFWWMLNHNCVEDIITYSGLHTITLDSRRECHQIIKSPFNEIIQQAPNLRCIRMHSEELYALWSPRPLNEGVAHESDGSMLEDEADSSNSSTGVKAPWRQLDELKLRIGSYRDYTQYRGLVCVFSLRDHRAFWSNVLQGTYSTMRTLDVANAEIDGPMLWKLVGTKLSSNLQKFAISVFCDGSRHDTSLEDAFVAFVNSCTLTGLAVFGGSIPLSNYLPSQGPTLQFLMFHKSQLRDRFPVWCVDLDYVRDTCPELDFLSLCVKRTLESEPERDLFAKLASFATLSTVRLDYSDGLDRLREAGDNRMHYDIINEPFVRSTWDFIRSNKIGVPLKRMAFRVHDYYQGLGILENVPAKQRSTWTIHEENESGEKGLFIQRGDDFVFFDDICKHSFPVPGYRYT